MINDMMDSSRSNEKTAELGRQTLTHPQDISHNSNRFIPKCTLAPRIYKNGAQQSASEGDCQAVNGCAAQHSGQVLTFEGKSRSVGEEASEVLYFSDLPGTPPLASWWYLGSPFPTPLLRTVLAPFNAHGSPISHEFLGKRSAFRVPSQGLMVLVFRPSSCPRCYPEYLATQAAPSP
jgi:hypothetical protein